QSWPVTCQQLFQDCLDLWFEPVVRLLLLQFCIQLRGDKFKKFRIVRQKRLLHVLSSKDQSVVQCAERHWAPKMDLIQSAVSCRTLEFHPQWIDRKSTRLNSSHVKISYAVF